MLRAGSSRSKQQLLLIDPPVFSSDFCHPLPLLPVVWRLISVSFVGIVLVAIIRDGVHSEE